MGDVVNLRRARKAKARTQSAEAAAENRVRHGRTRLQREVEQQEVSRIDRRHDGHRLGDGD
jgi:hypothetical protein